MVLSLETLVRVCVIPGVPQDDLWATMLFHFIGAPHR